MNDETKSQEQLILAHLQAGNRLTPIDALDLFGSFRLGARIYTLKKQGHPIETEIVKTASGKRVASYWIPQNGQLSLI